MVSFTITPLTDHSGAEIVGAHGIDRRHGGRGCAGADRRSDAACRSEKYERRYLYRLMLKGEVPV